MQQLKRKRKLFIVMPILVIPFLTAAFWALGGGKGNAATQNSQHTGLNSSLPEAKLKDESLLDKLAFYDKAARDSAKRSEWLRSDPSFKPSELSIPGFDQKLNTSVYEKPLNNPEQQLMERITQLQSEMAKPTTYSSRVQPNTNFSAEVDRLEQLMEMMSNRNTEDAEMKQLDNTLDKILEIQQPDRVNEKQNKEIKKEAALVVTTTSDSVANGFYSSENAHQESQSNAIAAVVHENQTLVNGAVIKLRLVQDIFIKSQQIAAGNFVFGIASLNHERLHVAINSIRTGNNLYPVNLELYDIDGLPGIYIPGAITRDVAKQSADNSLQLMDMTSINPSLKGQATAAGISATKSLLSRKVKSLKVMVKAGYKVLLHNKNNEQ